MSKMFGFYIPSLASQYGGAIYNTPDGGTVRIYEVTTNVDDPETHLQLRRQHMPDLEFVGEVTTYVSNFGNHAWRGMGRVCLTSGSTSSSDSASKKKLS
jgi:hypothetical protein